MLTKKISCMVRLCLDFFYDSFVPENLSDFAEN